MQFVKARETIRLYAEEKENEVKRYEKTTEELEYTVRVLENQVSFWSKFSKFADVTIFIISSFFFFIKNKVDLIKGDAERQRLQREEVELEVLKIRQRVELLTLENETFKVKVIELENDVKKLSGEQNLAQQIQNLAKLKVGLVNFFFRLKFDKKCWLTRVFVAFKTGGQ